VKVTTLLDKLGDLDVHLTAIGDRLIVNAPSNILGDDLRREIRLHKAALLNALRTNPPAPSSRSALLEYAARRLPTIRFTLRDSDDVVADVRLLDAIKCAVTEFQPGGNRIMFTIQTQDGRKVRAEWRAVADPALRRRIAVLLAQHAKRTRDTGRERFHAFGGKESAEGGNA